VDDGWRDGVAAGVAAALESIITTPVNHALDDAFAEDGGE